MQNIFHYFDLSLFLGNFVFYCAFYNLQKLI